jgi:hypothetical protein
VQARRSVILADPPAVHGSRTFQGAIFDVDGVLVDRRPPTRSGLSSR